MRYVILQTFVPEFRLEIFGALSDCLPGELTVFGGGNYFQETGTGGITGKAPIWFQKTENHFLLGRRFLWQTEFSALVLDADIVIFELNPRILSSWLLLLLRRIRGKRCIMWGHLYPRAGKESMTLWLRNLMMRLAGEVVCYTIDEVKACRVMAPRLTKWLAPNAVMWRDEIIQSATLETVKDTVLFVGRLVAEKRPMDLLEAFIAARRRLPEAVKIVFIGEGPQKELIKARVREAGMEDRVAVVGAIYRTKELAPYYERARVTVSAGYVGLSAMQSFGFGVPILIAKERLHSVELAICKHGENAYFYEAGTPGALAETLVRVFDGNIRFSLSAKGIAEIVRRVYCLDEMRDGFLRAFRRSRVEGGRQNVSQCHVAVAWAGMPEYAARVIGNAVRKHPTWEFTIIGSRDQIPYRDIDRITGASIKWVQADKRMTWMQLCKGYPDLYLMTSWPHKAFRSLAREARAKHGTTVVSMVDNYFRSTIKQYGGAFIFRLVFRPLFDAVWVPGKFSRRFLRFLGMPDDRIYEGLYAADDRIFAAPSFGTKRSGIVFVGQLHPRKGVNELLSALEEMREEGRVLNITFVGNGPLAPKVTQAGWRRIPFQFAEELAAIYQDASALILPSRIDHWGVVVHEAALCGCVLLVTRHAGSVAELVEHKRNGFVLEEASVDEILKAIAWLEGLSEVELANARSLSIAKAKAISVEGWGNTLDDMVERFIARETNGLV